MIHIGLIIYAILIHFCEAAIEAERGDKRHWTSVLITFMLFCIQLAVWNQPLNMMFIYLAVRCYFDLMYNKLKGQKWGYLGESAWTDRMLTKFKPVDLLIIRIMLSITFILISLI